MSNHQSIAVIMSTYNGEQYIVEQLDSIRLQSRMPDEVIIRDDCSTDKTASIIKCYIEQHRLDKSGWTLVVNERNYGWKRSFKLLIMAADTDLVFLCDQDDIWDHNKIGIMAKIMEDNPCYNVLASLVKPFYEDGSQHSYSASVSSRNSKVLTLASISPKKMIVERPGCSYCFRSSFAHDIQRYWKESYPHDAMLWRFALFTESLGLLDTPLVLFRRHGNNASRRNKATPESRTMDIDYYLDFTQDMINFIEQREKESGNKIALLKDYQLWLIARKSFIKHSDGMRAFLVMLTHVNYYPSYKSLLVDIACSLGIAV